MAELVDAGDSKSPGCISLRVQVSPALPIIGAKTMEEFFKNNNIVSRTRKNKNIITKDHFIIEKKNIYAGKHFIIDFWNSDFDNTVNTLELLLREASNIAKANILHSHLHRFGEEQGISGVAVLAESHISVHTWPERDYIAFDIFMCGDTYPELALEFLIEKLKPKKKKIKIIKRGKTTID